MSLAGSTSEEMRQMYLEWYFLPLCRLLYAQIPAAAGVALVCRIDSGRGEGRMDAIRVEDRLIPFFGEDYPPGSLYVPDLPVDLPGWVERHSTEEAANAVEQAENKFFYGGTWGYMGDHRLIVAFGSRCPDPDAPQGAWGGIAIHQRETDELIRMDRLLNPFFEDNFNVGRSRFRGTSLWSEPAAPLKGVPREVLMATSNARFADEHTRMLARQLIGIAEAILGEPPQWGAESGMGAPALSESARHSDEIQKIRDWTEEARSWQRRIRGIRG